MVIAEIASNVDASEIVSKPGEFGSFSHYLQGFYESRNQMSLVVFPIIYRGFIHLQIHNVFHQLYLNKSPVRSKTHLTWFLAKQHLLQVKVAHKNRFE